MYPASIRVSEHTKDLTDASIKERMLSANDRMVNEEIQSLNDFLTKNGIQSSVTKEQYIDAVLNNDVSKL